MTPRSPAPSPLPERWRAARRRREWARDMAGLATLVAVCVLALGLAALLVSMRP